MASLGSFFQNSSSRPDMHTNKRGWNKSWEDDLHQYDTLALEGAKGVVHPRLHHLPNNTTLTLEMEKAMNYVIDLQSRIRAVALMRLATDDFELKFKSMDSSLREDLILEGFYLACCSSPEIEISRSWCPEMTIRHLSQNGGKGYLDILMKIVESDPSTSSNQPILFSHSTFDNIYSFENSGDMFIRMQETRCHFISVVVWTIIQKIVSLNTLTS